MAIFAAGLSCLLGGLANAQETAPRSPQRTSIVPYYFPDTVGQHPSITIANFQAWLDDQLGPATGYDLKFKYYYHFEDLVTDMGQRIAAGDYPLFGALAADVAIAYRQAWDLDVLFLPQTSADLNTQRLAVCVRKDANIKSLADLKGRTLMGPELWKAAPANFERDVLGNALKISDLSSIVSTESSISALMGVYYKRADAALVSNRVFEILRERTANIWRAMSIIHESADLPLVVIVTFGKQNAAVRATAVRVASRMHEDESGRKALEYVRLKRMTGATWDSLRQLQTQTGDAHVPRATPTPAAAPKK